MLPIKFTARRTAFYLRRTGVLVILTGWLIAQSSLAQPPVSEGLIVRLDAGEQSRLQPLGAVEHWKNLAGGLSDFKQSDQHAQPSLVAVGDRHVMRFEGDGDHLRSVDNEGTELDELTVFVVAAPHQNLGDYSGFVAFNAPQRRDYETGFNIDLGAAATTSLNAINVEGNGFGGARDLLDQSFPWGTLHVVTVVVDRDRQSVVVRVDGKPTGSRDFQPAKISLEELTVGARYYTNGPGSQQVRGGLKGDIVELLIYDHSLSNEDTATVERYLSDKYAGLRDRLPATLELDQPTAILHKPEDPPTIQMLVPGFDVREIPIQLSNINNVRFRSDGQLVALGYNGDVHLLSDTDGDGLEDQAKLFWKNNGSIRGPIGLLVTPKDYPHGDGIITPSKGKLSLIVDHDGDDIADEERVIASGWKEISQNVDATGVAMDDEGYLYFGLGTADYANPYQIDSQGNAQYKLHGERGTVQRVSPDFKRRETVSTGIRFPIGFAFNAAGDLFCSEQEGATWLPNGNPFDELLHIEPGRHYGFPPRHPRHNPGVIDEPSVFDYSPQHQSTCGLIFNQPVNGGPVFGPDWWAGDAILSGESRGKIWRTKLSKSVHGYVASTQLLAALQMLTVDTCVAPNGDLVVACHSGPPDWGTGPTGMGKLFRIRMTDAEVARPVRAWPSSPQEITIAFDRPVDAAMFKGIMDQIVIQYGEFVRAGDPFENLVPPYAVVRKQSLAPRKELAVHGIALSPDRRNVLLQTQAMRANSHYAISLPYTRKYGTEPDKSLRQHPSIDLDLSLQGVQATLTDSASPSSSAPHWAGWLPHFDWSVCDDLTQRSAQHDQLRMRLREGGVLRLQSRLDLEDILRPKVQPGSTLDYQWPEEIVTLVAHSSQPFTLVSDEQKIVAARVTGERFEARLVIPSDASRQVPVQADFSVKPNSTPDFSVAVFTNEDDRLRALPLRRFVVPWASDSLQPSTIADVQKIAELENGNWGKGRRVFHSEAAGCFKCHAIHGGGPSIGPDLSNLVHRDYASVLRDIRNPSYAINPDYLGQIVVLEDGRVLTGVLQTKQGELYLGDASGQMTHLEKEQIDSIQSAQVSIMPDGIHEKLTETQLRDLMTFLLSSPPSMPLESTLQAPPVRTQAELAAVLAGSQPLPIDLEPMNVVLVAGKKDHGPGEHDYPAWQTRWEQLLSAADHVQVQTAWDFPDDQQIAEADVLIFFQKGAWNDQRQTKMDAYFDRGGGAVYIHWAVNGDDRAADFSRRIGLASKGGSIGYRHGPLSLQIHSTDHPIMRNVEPLQLYDESYWRLTGETADVTLLATSIEEGQPRPQLWLYQRSAGRVFVSIPGHYSWTFDDPIFRTILLRAIAWTADQPIDRFNDLVPLGARLAR